MPAPRPAATAVCLVAAAVLVVLTGCAGEQPTAPEPSGHHVEANPSSGGTPPGHSHLGDVPEPPASADWSSADATYLLMMLAHHRQAIDLAALAPERAADPRVRGIARTIASGQAGEILAMAAWLDERGIAVPTLAEVREHAATGGMPGMLSVAQVERLAAADGAAFDRMFLEGMVQHHQGAVGMAEDQVVAGEHVRVREMAEDVAVGQGAEIARMRALLRDLP